MKDDSDGDKKQQIHHIQNLYAFNLFCQKRFDDSMQVFAKLGTGTAALLCNRSAQARICETELSGLVQTVCEHNVISIGFNSHHTAGLHVEKQYTDQLMFSTQSGLN